MSIYCEIWICMKMAGYVYCGTWLLTIKLLGTRFSDKPTLAAAKTPQVKIWRDVKVTCFREELFSGKLRDRKNTWKYNPRKLRESSFQMLPKKKLTPRKFRKKKWRRRRANRTRNWSVVWNILYFSIYIYGNNNTNWLIFFRWVETNRTKKVFESIDVLFPLVVG
jgi:hypothetical protein